MALKQQEESVMSSTQEKRLKQVVMIVLMVFVVGVSIKTVHDEILKRRVAEQIAKEDQAFQEFFTGRAN
jgi:hypothetical protein